MVDKPVYAKPICPVGIPVPKYHVIQVNHFLDNVILKVVDIAVFLRIQPFT